MSQVIKRELFEKVANNLSILQALCHGMICEIVIVVFAMCLETSLKPFHIINSDTKAFYHSDNILWLPFILSVVF